MRRPVVDRDIMKPYHDGTLEQCVAMYLGDGIHLPFFHRFVLRSIIGVKAIYGDDSAVDSRWAEDVPNTGADKSILALYDSLPLEHCIELYKRQHDNLNRRTRFALRAMIGAKVVYGENYGKPPENRTTTVQFSK